VTKNPQRLSHKEFQDVFKKGKALQGSFLLLKITDNTIGSARVGVAVSAKVVKKATKRNYYKRILRTIIKEAASHTSKGYDIILVLNHKTETTSFEDLKKDAYNTFRKAGLI